MTFPTSMAKSAVPTTAQWPGIGLVSTYTEGLDVGYRFNHATGTKPLFPFGFGLSYTTFSYRHLAVVHQNGGYAVSVDVTNTGGRIGTDVAQAYLTFPKAAGEPPGQLAAFAPVTLAPGISHTVEMTIPDSQLATYQTAGWATVPGKYQIAVGDSSASQPTRVSVEVG